MSFSETIFALLYIIYNSTKLKKRQAYFSIFTLFFVGKNNLLLLFAKDSIILKNNIEFPKHFQSRYNASFEKDQIKEREMEKKMKTDFNNNKSNAFGIVEHKINEGIQRKEIQQQHGNIFDNKGINDNSYNNNNTNNNNKCTRKVNEIHPNQIINQVNINQNRKQFMKYSNNNNNNNGCYNYSQVGRNVKPPLQKGKTNDNNENNCIVF